MKNLIIFISLCTVLFSCKDIKPKVPQIIVSGQLDNFSDSTVTLNQGDEKYVFKVNDNGEFSDTIYDFKDGYFHFYAGNEYTKLYLEDGFDLFINLDVNEFDESLQYQGIGAAENNYLAQHILLFNIVNYWDFASFSEDTFLFKIDSFIATQNAFLDEYMVLVPEINANLLSLERTSNLYLGAYVKESYERYNSFNNKDFKVSENFYDYRKEVPLESKEALKVEYYLYYVNSYIENKSIKSDTSEHAFEILRAIDKEINDNELKKDLIYRSAKIYFANVKKIDQYWSLVSYMVTDKAQYKELKNIYTALKKIQTGEDSPKVNFADMDGKEFKLDDFKGKYVYIDCWAQWCVPCIKETPFLNILEEKYADKEITFIKLSFDSDKEAWLNYVKEHKIKENSFIVENNFKSEFAEAYFINSIPRFILLDKDLKIINANAARPSNEALTMQLDSLLN